MGWGLGGRLVGGEAGNPIQFKAKPRVDAGERRLVAASRGQTTQLAGMGGFGLKIHSMDGSLIILTLVAPPNIRAFSRPAKLQHLLMMTTVRSEAIAAAACVWTGPTDHRPFSFLGLPNTVMPFSLNSVHKCENHRCDALPSDPSCCWGYL